MSKRKKPVPANPSENGGAQPGEPELRNDGAPGMEPRTPKFGRFEPEAAPGPAQRTGGDVTQANESGTGRGSGRTGGQQA